MLAGSYEARAGEVECLVPLQNGHERASAAVGTRPRRVARRLTGASARAGPAASQSTCAGDDQGARTLCAELRLLLNMQWGCEQRQG